MKKLFAIFLAVLLLPWFSNLQTDAVLNAKIVFASFSGSSDSITNYRIVKHAGKEVTFEIDYEVRAEHGDTVYIGGWLYDSSGKAFGAYRPAVIPHSGIGKAEVVIVKDREELTAAEVEFFLFEPGQAPFIKKRFVCELESGDEPEAALPPSIEKPAEFDSDVASGRPLPEDKWEWIGSQAKTLISGGDKLYMVNAVNGDIFKYNGAPGSWIRIGGPAHSFAANLRTIYALSMDRGGIYMYLGQPEKWARIHDAAGAIYAGGTDLYFTDSGNGDIYKYNPTSTKNFKYDVEGPVRMGGPGHAFAVDPKSGLLYGLSADRKGVYAYNKSGQWKRIGGPAAEIFAAPSSMKDFHWLYAVDLENRSLYQIDYIEPHDRLVGGPAPEKIEQKRIGGPGADFVVGLFKGSIWGLSPDRSGIYEPDLSNNNKDGSYSWKKIGGPARQIFGGGTCPSDNCIDQLYVIDSEQNIWRYLGPYKK